MNDLIKRIKTNFKKYRLLKSFKKLNENEKIKLKEIIKQLVKDLKLLKKIEYLENLKEKLIKNEIKKEEEKIELQKEIDFLNILFLVFGINTTKKVNKLKLKM